MRAATAGLVLLAASILGAEAQSAKAPVESVTVTGTRSRLVIEKFVQSVAAPSHYLGKLARWEDGVCPIVTGLKPGFLKFVMQRVRDVAAKAGAPVNADAHCKPNIEIVFTTTPQALLDGVRKTNRNFLGYYDNEDQLAKLATVTRPIQAWYTTATRDVGGKIEVDSSRIVGPGLPIPCAECPGRVTYLPNATAHATSGTRLGDGLRSSLYHVIIAANPQKLTDYEIGGIADYVAMLALAQLGGLDSCQSLPTILNLLVPGCEFQTGELTQHDRGYLSGLYKSGADRTLRVQRDEVSYQIERAVSGH
jgi:hypothetical protein